MKIKIIALIWVFQFGVLPSLLLGQGKIKFKTVSKHLIIDLDSNRMDIGVNFSIENKTQDAINTPKITRAVNKDHYQDYEVACIITYINDKRIINCDYDINYGVTPRMQELKPNERGKIYANLMRPCFSKKGRYEVVFFIKVRREGNAFLKKVEQITETKSNHFIIKVI